jgi:hypothetical protein
MPKAPAIFCQGTDSGKKKNNKLEHQSKKMTKPVNHAGCIH